MKKSILIIDDDTDLCKLLKKYLENENYLVDISHTGTDGLNLIHNKSYYLIVLDIMLPQMNGFEVLTNLRKKSSVPVLMLTAKDSETDKVSGLRAGADDYITKPFSINEFIARVQSLIRRYTTFNNFKNEDTILTFNGLVINSKNRSVLINENNVLLTAKEFDLLYFLALHQGQVFTKKQIYSNVWNEEYAFDDNNIMVHIRRLRKKIELNPQKPKYIQTIWGVGYKFSQEV